MRIYNSTRIPIDQDQNLDRLSVSLGRQREIGLTINDELESQVGMLDDTEHLVDRTGNRLSIASRQLAKVAKRTKGCGKCFFYCMRYCVYVGHVVHLVER